MRAALALTKDAPPLTEAERLERIQRWTKSAAENHNGESRDLLSDLRKIRTKLDPTDHLTSRMVVSEFEKFIASKRTASDKKVQFTSARAENKNNSEVPEDVVVHSNTIPRQRPQTSVELSGLSKRPPIPKPTSRSKKIESVDEPKAEQRLDTQADPAWWHRKIRQGYLETEEMISKLVDQRKIEQKQLGVKAPPITRVPEYMSRKFPHTSHERRRLDRSMERLKKKHEACFGKPLTASELDSMSGRGATTEQQQKKRKGPISRVSGLHVPVSSHLATRDPIPLPKTMTSHLEDNWTPPKYPRSASKANKDAADGGKNDASKSKKEIKVLYEREKNAKEFVSPERTIPRKLNSFKKEWVERLYDAKNKKAVRDVEKEKEQSQQEKDKMNALYKELLMNKRRLSKYDEDVDHRDWRGKRVPSWRLKQILHTRGGGSRGSKNDDSSLFSGSRKKGPARLSKEKWNERPPKGLGLWLEGVIAKAKRQQDLARGAPGPVTEAFMRPLASYHF